MRYVPPELCAKCKGYKLLCGAKRCPILQRLSAYRRAKWNLSEPQAPTPPSPLVGERGYPKVPVALGLSPYGDPKLRDDPKAWVRLKLGLEEIANLRMEMLNPFVKVDAREPEKLHKGELIWGAISEKPVDVEARLKAKPRPPSFDGLLAPIGPSASAEDVKVTDNPKVDPLIERKATEGIKAELAVFELLDWKRDLYLIQKAFSVGLFGKRKRLVPTRWAITAVDQIASKYYKKEVLDAKEVSGIKYGSYSHLGNTYKVLLLPGPPSVEMYEIWEPGSLWASKEVVIYNFEGPLPNSKALDVSDGGFHALKEGALEVLSEYNLKAKVLVVRRISPEYYLPVGVWQVREGVKEAVRRALKSSNLTLEEALELMNEDVVKNSRTLRQKSLFEYIRRGGE